MRLISGLMKNLLQNLLILFSFGLCVLLAYQWHREGELRDQMQRSGATARSAGETIENLRNDVRRLEGEIVRTEGLRKQLAASAAATEQEIERLKAELRQQGSRAAELESFKVALAQANENIKTQNETLRQLAEERDEVAARFNNLAEDYNALVSRWNERVANTNAPRLTP